MRTAKERFWEKVKKSDGCWLWYGNTGGKPVGAPGQFHYLGRNIGAHRFSWELHKGKIPSGLFVCHTCDVGGCVNPDHLFLGTQKDNMQDMVKKGRRSPLGRAAQGSKNHNAKLTAAEVRDIRRIYEQGLKNQSAIAADFKIGQQAVSRIVRRERWAHEQMQAQV